jgi:hypothetical protein
MASESLDVLAIASQDLLDNSVPEPDMLLENLTIFSAVYFLQQTNDYVVRKFLAMLAADESADLADGDEPIQALQAITEACGVINGACVLLGLFDEAEGS